MAVDNNDRGTSGFPNICSVEKHDLFEISSNWQITNDRHFCDAISTAPLSQTPKRTSLEDVVSLDTCIRLQSKEYRNESCTVDIKLTNNQKIAGIAVVSEASVMEFYKQFGEYMTTIFAEFIDEFENNSVYFAEVSFEPPTPEASVKFAKLKSKESLMWLYGIKLILTEPTLENKRKIFDYDVINNFLQNGKHPESKGAEMAKVLQFIDPEGTDDIATTNMNSCLAKYIEKSLKVPQQRLNERETEPEHNGKNLACVNNSLVENTNLDIKKYIDSKFKDTEEKLMHRIDTLECKINQRLNVILKQLGGSPDTNESSN